MIDYLDFSDSNWGVIQAQTKYEEKRGKTKKGRWKWERESKLEGKVNRGEKEKEKGKKSLNNNNNPNKHYWNLITITHSFWNGTLTISGDGDMTDYTNFNSTHWGVTATSITKVIIKDPIKSVGSNSFRTYYTKIESVEIANSVLKINQYAFRNCVSLTSLNLPNNLTQIEECGFYQCSGLTSLILPNSLTQIGDIGFGECSALSSLILPNNLSIISGNCFAYCSGLTSLIIPVGVTTIQRNAFYNCDHLESVNISHTVITIISFAFQACLQLRNVTYCGTTDPGSSASLVFGSTKVEKVLVPTNYESGNTFCGKPIEFGASCPKINSKPFSSAIKSKLSSPLMIDFYILINMMTQSNWRLFLFQ